MLNFAFKFATRRSIAAAGGSRPVQGQKSSKHNENSNQRGNTDRLRDEVYQFEKLNMK